jgi:hypothetical protein
MGEYCEHGTELYKSHGIIGIYLVHISFSRGAQLHAVGSSDRMTELLLWLQSADMKNAKINQWSTCYMKAVTVLPVEDERNQRHLLQCES